MSARRHLPNMRRMVPAALRAVLAVALVLLAQPAAADTLARMVQGDRARERGSQGPVAELTRAEYRRYLGRVIQALVDAEARPGELKAVADSLPPRWRVEASPTPFDVPAYWIQRDLLSLARNPNAGRARGLADRVRGLLQELDAYEAEPRDASRERAGLERILARREFAGVHGPTWLDRLRQAVLSFLLSLLAAAFGASNVPAIGRALVFLLVALAFAALAFWVLRVLRTDGATRVVPPNEEAVSARGWTAWLADARAAADRGAWADAVRLAYWSGISFLESKPLWPPDRARTPREYLRLLPSDSVHRESLTTLTGTFEVVWYGRREADEGTFARAVRELEKLGCGPS